jgi:hypothetical protein
MQQQTRRVQSNITVGSDELVTCCDHGRVTVRGELPLVECLKQSLGRCDGAVDVGIGRVVCFGLSHFARLEWSMPPAGKREVSSISMATWEERGNALARLGVCRSLCHRVEHHGNNVLTQVAFVHTHVATCK